MSPFTSALNLACDWAVRNAQFRRLTTRRTNAERNLAPLRRCRRADSPSTYCADVVVVVVVAAAAPAEFKESILNVAFVRWQREKKNGTPNVCGIIENAVGGRLGDSTKSGRQLRPTRQIFADSLARIPNARERMYQLCIAYKSRLD